MKYKFSILAPHPDDEFLGCYQLIKNYHQHIDNIIFTTNGERGITELPDMIAYIMTRRLESSVWLETILSNCDLHFLNVPDAVGVQDLYSMYGYDIFTEVNSQTVFDYCSEKLRNIVGDNIVVLPNQERHPSHKLTNYLGETLSNKKVYYSINDDRAIKLTDSPGLYLYKNIIKEQQLYGYYYVYGKEELSQKVIEFKHYYFSQFEDFKKTKMRYRNWENYISEIPLFQNLKIIEEKKQNALCCKRI